MWIILAMCAALVGGCLAWAACWAWWRRRLAAEQAGRALERIVADAEHQEAHRAITALTVQARTVLQARREQLLAEREQVDLRLWASEWGTET